MAANIRSDEAGTRVTKVTKVTTSPKFWDSQPTRSGDDPEGPVHRLMYFQTRMSKDSLKIKD